MWSHILWRLQALDWCGTAIMLPNTPSSLFRDLTPLSAAVAHTSSASRSLHSVAAISALTGSQRVCFDLIVKMACRISAGEAKQGISE